MLQGARPLVSAEEHIQVDWVVNCMYVSTPRFDLEHIIPTEEGKDKHTVRG